ncbi:hypothetical protein YB2330_002783 [Saitoella coloradoensis]
MTKALLLIADGSEEIEFVTPYDVFVRAGIQAVSAGVELTEPWAVASRGVKIVPDTAIEEQPPVDALVEEYDILVLPGGAPGAKTFCGSEKVKQILGAFYGKEGKIVGTICAATTAIKAAGLHHSKSLTSHPSVKGELTSEYEYKEDRVVVDGNLVSSRGPGTALLFALTIVEMALGAEKRKEVEGPMVLSSVL